MSKILNFIFLIIVGIGVFIYQDFFKNVYYQSMAHYFPCKISITYDVGQFDTQFNLSRNEFLGVLREAEAVWEDTIDKNLFEYKEGGNLKVNLIYDERQATTEELKDVGKVVDNTRNTYDSLKSEYQSMINKYNSDRASFQTRVQAFETRKAKYEAEVTAANKKGGATKQTYDRLNSEKNYLNQEIASINNLQNNINSQVAGVNSLTKKLNNLASELNLNVRKFNAIGNNLGPEFEEGSYTRDTDGQRIDIYQFDNKSKLVRVLAHELGHALGLDHVEDSKAIMYRLNNGINQTPTATDITSVKNLCGVESAI